MLNHAPDRAAAIKNNMIAVREKNIITLNQYHVHTPFGTVGRGRQRKCRTLERERERATVKRCKKNITS